MINPENFELAADVRSLITTDGDKLTPEDFRDLCELYSSLDTADGDRLAQFEQRETWRRIFEEAGR